MPIQNWGQLFWWEWYPDTEKKHNLDNGFLKEIGLEYLEMIILCQNCLRLIKEKMHQSNIEQNCLTLENIPDELDLVDLEQQLIARSLLFIKGLGSTDNFFLHNHF